MAIVWRRFSWRVQIGPYSCFLLTAPHSTRTHTGLRTHLRQGLHILRASSSIYCWVLSRSAEAAHETPHATPLAPPRPSKASAHPLLRNTRTHGPLKPPKAHLTHHDAYSHALPSHPPPPRYRNHASPVLLLPRPPPPLLLRPALPLPPPYPCLVPVHPHLRRQPHEASGLGGSQGRSQGGAGVGERKWWWERTGGGKEEGGRTGWGDGTGGRDGQEGVRERET